MIEILLFDKMLQRIQKKFDQTLIFECKINATRTIKKSPTKNQRLTQKVTQATLLLIRIANFLVYNLKMLCFGVVFPEFRFFRASGPC